MKIKGDLTPSLLVVIVASLVTISGLAAINLSEAHASSSTSDSRISTGSNGRVSAASSPSQSSTNNTSGG